MYWLLKTYQTISHIVVERWINKAIIHSLQAKKRPLRVLIPKTQTFLGLEMLQFGKKKSVQKSWTFTWNYSRTFFVHSHAGSARGAVCWARRVLSPPHPPCTTCSSPVRCVRRDLLWPPLLPGFCSLARDPPLLLSSTHTSIVHRRTGGSCIHTH